MLSVEIIRNRSYHECHARGSSVICLLSRERVVPETPLSSLLIWMNICRSVVLSFCISLSLSLSSASLHNVLVARSTVLISPCSLHGYTINPWRLKLSHYVCKWPNNYGSFCLFRFVCLSENVQGMTIIQNLMPILFYYSSNRIYARTQLYC